MLRPPDEPQPVTAEISVLGDMENAVVVDTPVMVTVLAEVQVFAEMAEVPTVIVVSAIRP
jgi:hypothetical protein